uniref:U6 snRNA-associated Sm-like protein LSm4 n=1 Tax=Salmo trutta TaxID=8032 RepID=A0A673X5C6_SALTR
MLPLSLLKTAQNHPMLVELKNGETYNGHLVSCDNWMNINLREVICTSRVKGLPISTCRDSRVVTTDLKYVHGCLQWCKNTLKYYLSSFFEYLYFTFYIFDNFYSTTFLKKIMYFLHH